MLIPTWAMAARRKPKRRPAAEPTDGGDRGASASTAVAGLPAASGSADGCAASRAMGFSVHAAEASGIGSGSRSSQTPSTAQQPVVEISCQTADAHLTLHAASLAMVEAVEWSEAVAQQPPIPRTDSGSRGGGHGGSASRKAFGVGTRGTTDGRALW